MEWKYWLEFIKWKSWFKSTTRTANRFQQIKHYTRKKMRKKRRNVCFKASDWVDARIVNIVNKFIILFIQQVLRINQHQINSNSNIITKQNKKKWQKGSVRVCGLCYRNQREIDQNTKLEWSLYSYLLIVLCFVINVGLSIILTSLIQYSTWSIDYIWSRVCKCCVHALRILRSTDSNCTKH